MVNEQSVKKIGTYGSTAIYKEQPDTDSYNKGVIPFDTLPAQWWNWLWNQITLNEGRTVDVLDSIHAELVNVLQAASITPTVEESNQLKAAINKLIIDKVGTGELNQLTTDDKTSLVNAINSIVASKAQPNGIASLDQNGRIPYEQLPESAMEFKGTWDAITNTPTLVNGTGTKGDFYVVNSAATSGSTQFGQKFFVNDRVIYDGQTWVRLASGSNASLTVTSEEFRQLQTAKELIPGCLYIISDTYLGSTKMTVCLRAVSTDRYDTRMFIPSKPDWDLAAPVIWPTGLLSYSIDDTVGEVYVGKYGSVRIKGNSGAVRIESTADREGNQYQVTLTDCKYVDIGVGAMRVNLTDCKHFNIGDDCRSVTANKVYNVDIGPECTSITFTGTRPAGAQRLYIPYKTTGAIDISKADNISWVVN